MLQKPVENGATLDTFQQGLDVLRYFRIQLRLLSDERVLALLGALGSEPFTNGDAREILRVKRQASWKRLAQLASSGIVQKRGHTYRVAPFAREFVQALSSTMTGVLTGRSPPAATSASKETLIAALDGLETQYAKGKLSQADYYRHKNAIEEMLGVIR